MHQNFVQLQKVYGKIYILRYLMYKISNDHGRTMFRTLRYDLPIYDIYETVHGLVEQYRAADHQILSSSPTSANMFVSLGKIRLNCFVELSTQQGSIGHGKYYNLSANRVSTWPVAMF